MEKDNSPNVKEKRGKRLIVLLHIFTFIIVQLTMWVQLAWEEHFPKYWMDICSAIGYILLDFILSSLIIRLWISPGSSTKWANMYVGAEMLVSLGVSIDFFKAVGGIPIKLMLLRMVFLETVGILLLERWILILYQKACFAQKGTQSHQLSIQEKALALVGFLISMALIHLPDYG